MEITSETIKVNQHVLKLNNRELAAVRLMLGMDMGDNPELDELFKYLNTEGYTYDWCESVGLTVDDETYSYPVVTEYEEG